MVAWGRAHLLGIESKFESSVHVFASGNYYSA